MRTTRVLLPVAVILAIAVLTPPGLSAQEAEPDSATRARIDSLQARIRQLEARLDSLLAALARGKAADSAAEATADALAALRAAARAAAEEQEPQDTTEQAARTRNLNILNPEISVTGDFLGQYLAPRSDRNFLTAVPREFEFAFQAPLDPYTRTKIFITHEEEFGIAGLGEEEEEEGGHGGFEIEEGYLYWVGLPANLGAKAGKFRQQIGLYNRWHTHALLEVGRPLAAVAFLGDDGLIETGLSITAPPLPIGPGLQTLTLEVTNTANEALFGDSKSNLAFLGNLSSFWDLSASSYLELGGVGVYGENDDEGLRSTLFNVYLTYRWRPPGRGLYRDLRLSGEYYWARKDFGAPDLRGNGGYLQGNYRLSRRWIAGVRFDYLDDFGAEPDVYMLAPTVTWWQSEWVYLRLQYNYFKPEGLKGSHTITGQIVWALGPHKHETY